MGSVAVDRLDRTGELTGSFEIAKWPKGRTEAWGGGGTAVAFDGESIWVAVASTNSVVKLDTDGNVQGDYPVGRWPTAVLSAGGSIWVANFLDDTVTKLAADGTLMDTLPVGRGPHALLGVGQTIWVANFPGDSITVLPIQ